MSRIKHGLVNTCKYEEKKTLDGGSATEHRARGWPHWALFRVRLVYLPQPRRTGPLSSAEE